MLSQLMLEMLYDKLAAAGYPGGVEKAREEVIHTFASGSHLYGTKTPSSDTDFAGVYIEHPRGILGLHPREHFTHSTGDNDSKNTKDDEDLQFKALRHWAVKATQGNPTIIEFLFAPTSKQSVWNEHIVPNADAFVCRKQVNHFFKYAENQHNRLIGVLGRGKHGQRPELEEKFGYDTKMAAHLVRLMHEGIELMTTGRLSFPRPEASLLMDIRNGQWTIQQVTEAYSALEPELRAAEENSTLPTSVDQAKVSNIVAGAYLAHWEVAGLL